MKSSRKVYSRSVFLFVKGVFLAVSGFGVFWTVLAALDVCLGLGWGFTPTMLPIGVGFSVLALCGHLFIRFVQKIFLRVEEHANPGNTLHD
jgi:hypothetical protein